MQIDCFWIKYLDESNNILKVDTADLSFGCAQNLWNSSSNWAVQDTHQAGVAP